MFKHNPDIHQKSEDSSISVNFANLTLSRPFALYPGLLVGSLSSNFGKVKQKLRTHWNMVRNIQTRLSESQISPIRVYLYKNYDFEDLGFLKL